MLEETKGYRQIPLSSKSKERNSSPHRVDCSNSSFVWLIWSPCHFPVPHGPIRKLHIPPPIWMKLLSIVILGWRLWIAAVLESLWQVGFMANLSKCGAGWRELQYLGSYVGGRCALRLRKKWLESIEFCHPPKSKKTKGGGRFLGSVGFQYLFVMNFPPLPSPCLGLRP